MEITEMTSKKIKLLKTTAYNEKNEHYFLTLITAG